MWLKSVAEGVTVMAPVPVGSGTERGEEARRRSTEVGERKMMCARGLNSLVVSSNCPRGRWLGWVAGVFFLIDCDVRELG